MSEPRPVVLQLFEAAQEIEAGNLEAALSTVDQLLAAAPAEGTAVDRLARAFAAALKARLAGDASGLGNLYVDTRDPRDMLKAFEVLAAATPFIRFGHAAANHALLHAIGPAPRVHIIDIGLGSGVQWLHLLDAVARHARGTLAVRLTGIDVPAHGTDPLVRLRHAGAMLTARAAELGISFTFTPVAGLVEDLDLHALAGEDDSCLVVNAALALHHVPSSDGRRDAVLARLRALKPAALCLAEPDVEHNALPVGPRITESIVHYLTVFDALEATLAQHGAERATLETAFFGREILNIVVGEGDARVERHERHDAWQARLSRGGFTAIDLSNVHATVAQELSVTPPFAIEMDGAFLVLSWRNLPVLAVSAWTPAK